MTKPLISVIIVAYKSGKYISKCIRCLRESSDSAKVHIEIIVILNDKDNPKYKLIRCIIYKNKKNLGFAKAANFGAKKATGEWILLINPDTQVDINFFNAFLKYKNYKHIGIIAPKVLNPDRTLQYTILPYYTLWDIFLEQSYLYKIFPQAFHHPLADKSYYKKSHEVNAVSGCCFFVKNVVFQKIGGFDERFFMYFEDLDFCKKVTNASYKIIFAPQIKILHFLHESHYGYIPINIFVDSFFKYMEKNTNIFSAYIGIILINLGGLLRLLYWLTKKILLKRKYECFIVLKNKIIYNKQLFIFSLNYLLKKLSMLYNHKVIV